MAIKCNNIFERPNILKKKNLGKGYLLLKSLWTKVIGRHFSEESLLF